MKNIRHLTVILQGTSVPTTTLFALIWDHFGWIDSVGGQRFTSVLTTYFDSTLLIGSQMAGIDAVQNVLEAGQPHIRIKQLKGERVEIIHDQQDTTLVFDRRNSLVEVWYPFYGVDDLSDYQLIHRLRTLGLVNPTNFFAWRTGEYRVDHSDLIQKLELLPH